MKINLISFDNYMIVYTIYKYLSNEHKKNCFFLAVFMIFTACLEVVSLGLVIPFLGLLTNPSYIYTTPVINDVTFLFSQYFSLSPTISISIMFILIAILVAIARIYLLKFNSYLVISIGADFSSRVLKHNLNQSYDFHIKTNTSETLSNIRDKVDLTIFTVLMPTLTLVSNFIIAFAIIITLFIINIKMASVIVCIFLPLYFIVIKYSKRKLNSNSLDIQFNQPMTIKIIQEALGSIRDIILNGNQNVYIKKYQVPDYKLRAAQANNIVMASSPRFILECTGMVVIAVFAIALISNNSDFVSTIPTLGALALGAQRTLPAMQQVFYAWASIVGYGTGTEDVLKSLRETQTSKIEKSLQIKKKIKFRKHIIFKDISYLYLGTSKLIIKNLKFEINKGDRVAVVGKTGSGKSTMIDLLMGLLKPTSGKILIDNVELKSDNIREWQENISLVPQSIFLSDETILQNVCLGVEEDHMDLKRAKECLKQVNLDEFIASLPMKYYTEIGERGVRLSGGQRQRIGIARALYKNTDILILDEATNALDEKTEEEIIQNLNHLNKKITIIIISHRLKTVSFCNKIIKIS